MLMTDLRANSSLVELATADPRRDETLRLVASALEHEGVVAPGMEEAGRLVASEICASIVEGERAPYDGARLIWWKIVDVVPSLNGELGQFAFFASEWEDDEEHRDEYEADIRTAAESFRKSTRGPTTD